MFSFRSWLIALSFIMLGSVTGCEAQPKVTITTQDGRTIAFQVEIADTSAKREMGLQYRRELTDDKGMIFLFPEESIQSFWMKNTPISLDMIFINRQRKIAGIVEQTLPFSLEPRSVAAPSQFVLEINGGLAKKYRLKAGDSVRFDGFARETVSE
ncbi:MAG TPA: DUF192 domain-containing protein [Candidatus Binatia bacterium]